MKNLHQLGILFILSLVLITPSSIALAGGPPPSSPVMGDGNWNNCGSDSHTDSGGSGSDYSDSESFTETYCSDVGGDCIQFVFTAFDTESCCDHLSIYDGTSTSDPLIGTFDGSSSPGTVASSSGCLTFEWTSDGSITYAGWEASFSCITCPTCSDGILNGQEIGIDCGGPTCPACPCASLPITNDEACCATAVTVNPDQACGSTTAGTVANATASFNGNTCFGTDDDDVWFSFVATNTTHYVDLLNVAGSVTDMYHAVYGGTCNATGASLVCSDANSSTVTGLTIGNTYYIRVYTYTSTGGQNSTFDVCVGSPPPPPANDEPCNAIAAVVNPSTVCTSVTNGWCIGATQTQAGCLGTADDDVWFSFVALSSSHDIAMTNISGTTDLVQELFSGTCGSLTSEGCYNSNSSSYTSLTVGATYYVRIYTWSSTGSNTSLDLCITSPCGVGSTEPTCNLDYSVSTISHSPYNYNQGSNLSFADDEFADTYSSIGFDFCFDGIIYTDLLVSSNGYVIFPSCYSTASGGTVAPSGSSPYSISAAIPNNTDAPTNAIMLWHDIDPSVSGNIRTKLEGSAPNRVFVIKYDDVAMYSASCNADKFNAQLMLYETTNDIEIHVTEKIVCSTWNGGDAILGLNNYDGTVAVTNGAHNYPTDWAETNTAYRFTSNCGALCSILPVELIEFKGTTYKNYNLLEWKTATEINNAYFVLERSDGGPKFEEVAIIPGGGNANELLAYNYQHNNPEELEYYRLKQVDFDGRFEYSNIIAVKSEKEIAVNVYPNPITANLNLNFLSEKEEVITILVADILGNSFSKRIIVKKGDTKITLTEFNQLNSGLYSIKIINNSNVLLYTDKVIKH